MSVCCSSLGHGNMGWTWRHTSKPQTCTYAHAHLSITGNTWLYPSTFCPLTCTHTHRHKRQQSMKSGNYNRKQQGKVILHGNRAALLKRMKRLSKPYMHTYLPSCMLTKSVCLTKNTATMCDLIFTKTFMSDGCLTLRCLPHSFACERACFACRAQIVCIVCISTHGKERVNDRCFILR